jgi:hypothetical protein
LIALLSDADTEATGNAAECLWSLAENHRVNQTVMLDNDALPLLSALANTDHNAEKALRALEALQSDLANQELHPLK